MKKIYTIIIFLCLTNVYANNELNTSLTQQEYQNYETIVKQLRCLVCHNQTLYDSIAPLSLEIKQQVADLIKAGASNQEIFKVMQQSYGQYILYKPKLNKHTLLLWCMPILLLISIMLFFLMKIFRLKQKNLEARATYAS